MYSYVSNKLAGLFESLPTVMAAVREPTAVNVFLVVSRIRGEGPVRKVRQKKYFLPRQADKEMVLRKALGQSKANKHIEICF